VAFLLDTAAFIFAAKAPEQLSKRATEIFADNEAVLLLSSISLTEIGIKSSLGKISFPLHEVKRGLEDLRIQLLPYTAAHAFGIFDLPVHHSDPFDRQIIAQALSEELPVITSDRKFRLYDNLTVIW
jgi:PIN domain nuclease of toxin-antitoxin system